MTVSTVSAQDEVIVGVDTHQQTHHAAVVTTSGSPIADGQFEATATGYRQLLEWAVGFGRVEQVGVESSASYGAGLTRVLSAAGVQVIEVNSPDLPARYREGKTDQIDAYAAAMAVVTGRATAHAKDTTGAVESIRMAYVARSSAVDQRTVVMMQIRDLATTAPTEIADQLKTGSSIARINKIEKMSTRTGAPITDPVVMFVRTAQRLVQRYRLLDREVKDHTRDLRTLVASVAPTVLGLRQVGVICAAQFVITAGQNVHRMRNEATFAKLCGVAPLPASSGKKTRHRLNRGGDRQANSALHMVAIGRLKDHPPTIAYAQRRKTEKTTKEIIRCLKRFIAREVFTALKTDLATA